MNSRKESSASSPRTASEAPTARKRFVIQKLEERIAPKKGGKGTNNCGGSVGGSSGSSIY